MPDRRLRPVLRVLPVPPMTESLRRFIDWVAAYNLVPPGLVLRMSLRSPAALGDPRMQTGYRFSGTRPDRLTPQRARVMELVENGLLWRASELAEAAGVTTAVIALLALLKAHIIGSIGWWIMIALLLVLIGTTLFVRQAKTPTKETRPSYFAEPMRESPNDISWNSSISVLLIFPGAWIIAAVAHLVNHGK